VASEGEEGKYEDKFKKLIHISKTEEEADGLVKNGKCKVHVKRKKK